MQEVITEWTGPGESPKLTIMYFGDEYDPAVLRSKVHGLWDAFKGNVMPSTTWNVRSEVRTIDPATGSLTAVGFDPTPQTGAGTSTGTNTGYMPDAAQVLLRWDTGAVVAGRRLKGRTFAPGWDRRHTSDGNLIPAVRAAAVITLNTWLGSGPRLSVWHRPSDGAGGVVFPVEVGDVWGEVAVLRRRRG